MIDIGDAIVIGLSVAFGGGFFALAVAALWLTMRGCT